VCNAQVRERSARSVPMGKTGVNRTAGTPDSLSDNESSPYWRTPVRKPATPAARKSSAALTGSLPASRPASRPQSRPGSKPPSRHGSNLSLDSTGEYNDKRVYGTGVFDLFVQRVGRILFSENLAGRTRR